MECEDCARAASIPAIGTHDPPHQWLRFNPACLGCGCRLLWCIRKKRGLTQLQREQRGKAALADWKAFGHSEKLLLDGAQRNSQEWKEWARERRARN